MKPTKIIHDLGQSLWLDNITRDLLNSGTLQRYIDEFLGDRTDLESNHLRSCHQEQRRLRQRHFARRFSCEIVGRICFSISPLADLTRAADLFRPIFDRTDGVDGWVSLEVSPSLAYDTQRIARGGARSPPARRQTQPLHQNSRHRGGIAGDRSGDFRRHSDQRHAAVLPRAICRRGGSLSARRRAAHRGRPQSCRRLGRLAVCQPLGCRGERKGARPN